MAHENQKDRWGRSLLFPSSLFLAAVVGIIVAGAVAIFALAPHKEEVRQKDAQSDLWKARTVADGIEDDGKGTALIHAAHDFYQHEPNLNSLLARKTEWQRMFPTKHVVSATHVTFDSDGSTHTQKLIIFYEER